MTPDGDDIHIHIFLGKSCITSIRFSKVSFQKRLKAIVLEYLENTAQALHSKYCVKTHSEILTTTPP